MKHSFITPDTFYQIVSDFGPIGIGNGCDVTASWDKAVNHYADMVARDVPSRIFRIEMDAENCPASIVEVTAEADADLRGEAV